MAKKNNNKDKTTFVNKKFNLNEDYKSSLNKLKKEKKEDKTTTINNFIDMKKEDIKNVKNILKAKLIYKNKILEINKNYNDSLKRIKTDYQIEVKKLKNENIEIKSPFLNNDKNSTNKLLMEKHKNKIINKRRNLEFEKTDYKKAFRQFPLRMFKEIKRIRWGRNDLEIFKKFFSVVVLIILCALFIWGCEELLTELLKVAKISII